MAKMINLYCERSVVRDNTPPPHEWGTEVMANKLDKHSGGTQHHCQTAEMPSPGKASEAFLLCVLNGDNQGFESAAWVTLACGVGAPKK